MANQTALDRLKAQLLTSGLQQRDQPLYQVINQLIGFLRDSINDIDGQLNPGGSGGGGVGSGLAGQSYLTAGNDFSTLPNSRQLIAGNGIGFNNAGRLLTISANLPTVIDGIDGVDGAPGPQGIDGLQGIEGLIGPPGIDGLPSEEYEVPFIQFNEILPLDGEWIDIPYDSANFGGSGTLIWDLSPPDLTAYAYTLLGRDRRTCVLNIKAENTSVSGVGNILEITLPPAIIPASGAAGPVLAFDAGTGVIGFYSMAAGNPILSFIKLNFTDWAASTNSTSVYITVTYRI